MGSARTLGVESYLEEEKRRIDDALQRALPAPGTSPAVFHDAMRHTLLLPGKRVRGILTLAASDLFQRRGDAVLWLACSVEMVHAASLILDDLPSMDNATLRRGEPVLHRVVGEANAILAAVGLLNAAFAAIHRAPALEDSVRREATLCLAAAIGAEGLIGGQVQDLASTGKRLDLEALEWIHSHKTGALFIAAAELGSLAAGGKARDREALRRYAKNLGLAFQITDDLLDHCGSPEKTGKDAGLDRHRTTFVNLCGTEGARRLVDDLIDASVAVLKPFGRRGAILSALAEFVRLRDR